MNWMIIYLISIRNRYGSGFTFPISPRCFPVHLRLCRGFRFGLAGFSFIRLGLTWLGLAWLGLVRFGIAWLGFVKLGFAGLGLVRFGMAGFGLAWDRRRGRIALRRIQLVFNIIRSWKKVCCRSGPRTFSLHIRVRILYHFAFKIQILNFIGFLNFSLKVKIHTSNCCFSRYRDRIGWRGGEDVGQKH